MKTFILLSLLAFAGTSAFAQGPFNPNSTVRFDTPGSDDGLFVTVIQSNIKFAQIKTDRIVFDHQQPKIAEIQELVPIELLRTINATDYCYKIGSAAKIVNPYMALSNVIGTVVACDGRQVILDVQPNPDTHVQQIFQMGDLEPSHFAAVAFKKGDSVVFSAKGFTWSGLTGTVDFSNNHYVWVSYQDLQFQNQHTKVLVQDLQLNGMIFQADFSIDSLGLGLENISSVSYLAKQSFYRDLGTSLDRFLPINQGASSDSIRYQARLFALLAIRPVVESGTSEVFLKNVIPTYQETIKELGVDGLTRLMITPDLTLSAGCVLEAVLTALSAEVSGSANQQQINDQKVQVGLLMAGNGTYSALSTYLAQESKIQALMKASLVNQNLSPYVVAYQLVLNYLKEKSR